MLAQWLEMEKQIAGFVQLSEKVQLPAPVYLTLVLLCSILTKTKMQT